VQVWILAHGQLFVAVVSGPAGLVVVGRFQVESSTSILRTLRPGRPIHHWAIISFKDFYVLNGGFQVMNVYAVVSWWRWRCFQWLFCSCEELPQLLGVCFAAYKLVAFYLELCAPILDGFQAEKLRRCRSALPVFIHAYFINSRDLLANLWPHMLVLLGAYGFD